jgi:cholinesterase
MSKSAVCRHFLTVIFVLFSVAASIQAAPFTAVVVYGDSLSDNGNVYGKVGFPPDPPYFQGRRSDGEVAVEYLASALGVPLVDNAWLGATTGVGNYGDGGTTTSFGTLLSPLPPLPGMLTTFTATQGSLGPYISNGLFVIWGGANDFLAPSPSDTTPAAIIARAVTNELTLVGTLRGMSVAANHILVPGMPDLGLTPYFQSFGPIIAGQASAITNAFNNALAANLPAGVLFYDTAGLVRSIVANPAAYGLTNVTDPCFNGTSVCSHPDQYLFYDDFHPTTAVHAIIGEAFAETVVPEPSTILLMSAGLALCGWRVRRKLMPARG